MDAGYRKTLAIYGTPTFLFIIGNALFGDFWYSSFVGNVFGGAWVLCSVLLGAGLSNFLDKKDEQDEEIQNLKAEVEALKNKKKKVSRE